MQQPIHIIQSPQEGASNSHCSNPPRQKFPAFLTTTRNVSVARPARGGSAGSVKRRVKHTHTQERGKSLTLLPHQSLLLLSWHLRNASHTSWQGETYDS